MMPECLSPITTTTTNYARGRGRPLTSRPLHPASRSVLVGRHGRAAPCARPCSEAIFKRRVREMGAIAARRLPAVFSPADALPLNGHSFFWNAIPPNPDPLVVSILFPFCCPPNVSGFWYSCPARSLSRAALPGVRPSLPRRPLPARPSRCCAVAWGGGGCRRPLFSPPAAPPVAGPAAGLQPAARGQPGVCLYLRGECGVRRMVRLPVGCCCCLGQWLSS